MKKCLICIGAIYSVLLSGVKPTNTSDDMVETHVVNNQNAPLLAMFDMTNVNKRIKAYISDAFETKMSELVNLKLEVVLLSMKIEDDVKQYIENVKGNLTLYIKQEIKEYIDDVKQNVTLETSEDIKSLRDSIQEIQKFTANQSYLGWPETLKQETHNQNNGGKSAGGSNYIQWGRSTCISRNSELIYGGYTGGSSHTREGSAVNHLCLPKQPQWVIYDAKVNNNPFVGAAVFNIYDINIKNSLFDKSKYDLYSFPCAVCHTKIGSSTLMIPGRKDCIAGWKKEYTGYLMSGWPGHASATEYICVDADSERLKKASNWTDKSILYAVAAKCNGVLPCPPYVDGREMTCVVCSK